MDFCKGRVKGKVEFFSELKGRIPPVLKNIPSRHFLYDIKVNSMIVRFFISKKT